MRTPNMVVRGLILLWVALSLLATPLAPAFAAASTDNAAHATAATGGTHATHAGHAKTQQDAGATGHQDTSCAQHEQCSGKCCAACAQCFTATSAASASFVAVLAVYTPTVPRLHNRLVAAAHTRPPAA